MTQRFRRVTSVPGLSRRHLALLFCAGSILVACPQKSQTEEISHLKRKETKELVTPPPLLPQPAPSQALPTPLSKRRYVVAALGDSLTDARSGGGYLQVLRKECPESVFLNFGKGGDMTNQMRRRWENDIRPQIGTHNITTLLVFGGVNDLYSDLTASRINEKIEADLTSIFTSAHSASLEVVAITVSPWGGFKKYWNERRGENTQLLNSWLLAQVTSKHVDKVVDSYSLLSCGDHNMLCPEYETRFHDGIHFGKIGHTLLGKRLAEQAFADCL